MDSRFSRIKHMFCPWAIFSFLLALSFPCAAKENLTPEAKHVYQEYYPAIVQARVISRGSREKASIGSGFFFTENGLVATNYHVVAEAANYPSLYTLELIMHNGETGSLEILNIDPVHDVAVLRADKTSGKYLELKNSGLKKGTKIFSFGNPYDMGMIVVEGLFNGLLEHSRYTRILFSGALNPGMSGGPAVFSDGSVFGVNVSTAGNDVSFFVPVEYLKRLYEEIRANGGKSLGPKWKEIIDGRLKKEQGSFLQKLLQEPRWPKRSIGIARVPSAISEELKCWGRSGDNRKLWVKDEYLTCSTEDYIYISETLYTGMLYLNYESYVSRSFDPVRFYNNYELYASNREFTFSNAGERDVMNFSCSQEFVNVGGKDCKVELCVRAYQNFKGLFDMNFQITRINTLSEGFVINGAMLGFTQVQGKAFMERFLREIEWQR